MSGFDPNLDFLGLLRPAVGVENMRRMPVLDALLATLGAGNLLNVQAGGSAPVANQPQTAWLQLQNPSWQGPANVFLWDKVSGGYIGATPALFANMLAALGNYSTWQWQFGNSDPNNGIGNDGDYWVRTNYPGGIWGPKAAGAYPASPFVGSQMQPYIFSANGAPNGTIGNVGDLYIQQDGDGGEYIKGNSGWIGPVPGSTVYHPLPGGNVFFGNGAPDNGTGVSGDMFFSLDSNNQYAKVANAWTILPSALTQVSVSGAYLSGNGTVGSPLLVTVPYATTGANGLMKLATQSEVDTGTETSHAVTAQLLHNLTPGSGTALQLISTLQINTTAISLIATQGSPFGGDGRPGTPLTIAASTTSVAGVAALATQAQVTAGVSTNTIITPATLAGLTAGATATALRAVLPVATSGAYWGGNGTPATPLSIATATQTQAGLIKGSLNTDVNAASASDQAVTPSSLGGLSVGSTMAKNIATAGARGGVCIASGSCSGAGAIVFGNNISFSRTGVGAYTATFATASPDTAYAVAITVESGIPHLTFGSKATGGFSFTTLNGVGGANVDSNFDVMVFRVSF